MTSPINMQSAIPVRPLTGRTVLVCLLAFFGVVVGMNVFMMKLAVETLPGTDVDSPYKASLAYNSEIHAAEDQAARNWSVQGHVKRNSDGSAEIKVVARDAAGFPLSGLAFSARLSRPTDKRADRMVELGEASPGTYLGSVAQVLAGQWDVVIEAARGSERLFLSRNRVVFN
jgi:nitrogen fixation protein FixH